MKNFNYHDRMYERNRPLTHLSRDSLYYKSFEHIGWFNFKHRKLNMNQLKGMNNDILWKNFEGPGDYLTLIADDNIEL